MNPFFNTEGPIISDDHYHIDPLTRIDWDEVQFLIQAKKYFVLHAPRQTGKTTTLLSMIDKLNQSGNYCAVYVNIEAAQAARNDKDDGIKIVCRAIATQVATQHIAKQSKEQLTDIVDQVLASQDSGAALSSILTQWSSICDKPIVLMIDEVDALMGDTLISLLRQIRAGYTQRPAAFPQSIILCGVRDVQDYRINSHNEIITGGSAFNIKAASMTMPNFSQEQIKALFDQHTNATGQSFEKAIFDALWQDTKGQPWLVNALAHQLTWKDKANRDRAKNIDLQSYLKAREVLIYSRTTHLHQLSDKLKEPRVHSVIAPMLAGVSVQQMTPDDVEYVVDLGLVTRAENGALAIANKIYQEVIPRELAYGGQMTIEQQQAWYVNENNHLDMPKLLTAFVQFFRENADIWLEKFDYKEAGPQLLMQAFLQRVINGGGRIQREYALGRGRTDLLIEWPTTDKGFYGNVQCIAIELKIQYGTLNSTIEKGLKQTAKYADAVNAQQSHLVIFNRDENTSWQDKVWQKEETYQDNTIFVWGC